MASGALQEKGLAKVCLSTLSPPFPPEKAEESLKAVAADCDGGLEGLGSATGALSLNPALVRTSFYTLGSMTSQVELRGLYCVR